MLNSKSIATLEIGPVRVHVLDTTSITEADFSAELPEALVTQAKLSFKSVKRQKEWLSVRLLLKRLLNEDVTIAYEPTGAPYLINSEKNISISHSGSLVAIVLSDERVGVDVQMISDKPLRLSSHFLSDEEIHIMGQELDALTAVKLWCAKEAVYKYLSIPETPLIGGICLKLKEEAVIEVNHGLNLYFKHYGNALFAVALGT